MCVGNLVTFGFQGFDAKNCVVGPEKICSRTERTPKRATGLAQAMYASGAIAGVFSKSRNEVAPWKVEKEHLCLVEGAGKELGQCHQLRVLHEVTV